MSCLETLKRNGLKLTPQRRLIADIIHNAHRHFTADEIINIVQQRMPGVNKSTIYRTLDVLEQSGAVYKSESSRGYIYHHAEEGHHHHLVCSKCGTALECSEDLFSPLERSLVKRYGFSADFRHMIVSGLCDSCRKTAG